jgi:shikimate dehydrogenase
LPTLRHFGLIGYPLEHSFSVSYFRDKFKREGIDASYRNFPLERVSGFETLIREEKELCGLNVTVPYKQAIIPYLDALSQTARTVQAVNTICFCRKDERRALTGHNTDIVGFERSLKPHLKKHHTSALVLGTGGSSRAIAYVMESLGIKYQMVSRSPGEGKISYAELNPDLVNQNPLIINCTPLGMHPAVETCPDIPYSAISKYHLLFDLVYNPEKTLFLSRGEQQGAVIVNGYEMLVYQAEASWEIWNRKR